MTKTEIEKKLKIAEKELDDLRPLKKYTKKMEKELLEAINAFDNLKDSFSDYDYLKNIANQYEELISRIDNAAEKLIIDEPVIVPAMINAKRVIESLEEMKIKYPKFNKYFNSLINFIDLRM